MGEEAMKRAFVICLATIIGLASPARADQLTGEQIRTNLSGAHIVGVNEIGTPYNVWLKRGGSLQGLMGKLNQFDDHGRWWVAADKLCVQWELWLFAKQTCYAVEVDGDQITRIEDASRTVITSTLVREGKFRSADSGRGR